MTKLQLAAFVVAWTVATTTPSQATSQSPASESIPILFNDHHVNVHPSLLQQGRVLGAIVYNGTLLVPLRGMFEQMGASVSYDSATKSVTAHKDGTGVQLTVGKTEVVINGESRPLDVAAMIYKGTLLVPIRVISEALGAYVQWVPDQRLVVVRYTPPTPAPAPTQAPTPVVTTAPAPPPAARRLGGFLQYGIPFGKVNNEFATNSIDHQGNRGLPGTTGYPLSAVVAGALTYNRFAVKVDWRQDVYHTNLNATTPSGGPGTRFVTIDGGTAVVNQFSARQSALDVRLEYKLFNPNVYFGAGYLRTDNNYGYPRLFAAGGGIEKLPNFKKNFDYFASVFYYPNANGTYTNTIAGSPHVGNTFWQSYNILKYDAGIDYSFVNTPLHVYGGYSGDQYTTRNSNAPVDQSHYGPYVGLGLHF